MRLGVTRVIGYLRNVWRLRYFWMALVRNDLRNRYRRSIIGLGWSLLHPIAMTTVLCLVFAGLFHADIKVYGPYLLSGLVTWTYISAAIKDGCNCYFQGEAYIRQYPAPLAIYALRTVLGAGFHFLLGLVVVVALVWIMQGSPQLAALPAMLPALLLLFVFGWALAVCMGIINVMFQDTQHLTDVVLQILFYTTPILIYADLMRERNMGWLLWANPLASFIELVRQPMVDGCCPPLANFAIAGGATLLASVVAAMMLWRFERRLIFSL
jgi:ABC-type polysaccharide/polyol phosphate export permease